MNEEIKVKMPIFKIVLPFIIIWIICFSLGFGASSLIKRHNAARIDTNRVYLIDRGFDNNMNDMPFRFIPSRSLK